MIYCGSDDHPWFNCRKKPEGWKPPKKSTGRVAQQERGRETEVAGESPAVVLSVAPTLPVDTIPKPRGRPRTGFDKKAYDKERMKKARAALKEEKK